ncbi:MAG: cadherin-like beta sandwich domain-containing protein [Anaerocolumna sp.]
MGNVAFNKTTTAYFSVNPFTANKTVNGITSALNRWVGSVPGGVNVDLGNTYWIDKWIIRNLGVIAPWDSQYNMTDYKLQGSNVNLAKESDWTDICSIADNMDSETEKDFTPIRFQYFRTYVSSGLACNKLVASIIDFELYEYDNPPYLSNLTLSDVTMNPVFNKQVFDYSVQVPQSLSQISVTPTTETIGATITVNGINVSNSTSLPIILNNSGNTIITIVVYLIELNISETYTVIASKNSVSPNLSNLIVNEGYLMPDFNSKITNYEAYLDDGVTSVTITPTTVTPDEIIIVNDQKIASGQTSQPIDLSPGDNQISILVQDASPQIIYKVMINI